MAAAMPVNRPLKAEGIQTIRVPRGTAYSVDYYGPYDKVGPAHLAIDRYFKENGLTLKPPVIEEYVTDPTKEPDSSKWLTRIYYFAQ